VCRVDTECAGGKLCNATASPPVCVDAICGDGKLGVGEACDDLNTASGDGCSSACAVETGWSCENEPSSCAPIAECATDDDCGTKQRCDVQAGVCAAVECRVDADCAGTATCNAETYACEQSPGDPEGVFAAGSGISCSVRPERTGRGLVYAGLLSLGLLVGYRRRRRD
jgi:MYXO-CTERM domain-containing protein